MIFPTDLIAAVFSSFDVALGGTSVSSGMSLKLCIPMVAAKMFAVTANGKKSSHLFTGQTQHFSGFSGSVTGTACHLPYLNLS